MKNIYTYNDFINEGKDPKKGSGKKPTKEMLKQEKKIKTKK